MNKGQNLNLRGRHFIEETVTLDENLPDSWFVEFRDDATAFAEDVEGGGSVESLNQQPLSRGPGVLGDVGDGSVEHPLGLVGPDYASLLRSHFRRMARSTSSCGIVRPAATSAWPRSTAWRT